MRLTPAATGLFALGAAFLALPSDAATVVVPNAFDGVEAPTENVIPFSWNLISQRYQQLYLASEVASGSPAGPLLISKIAFRPDDVFGDPFDVTLPDVQINLSTTSAPLDGLSSSYDDNPGADDQVVVERGPLALSSEDRGPTGGPKRFDVVIEFDVPFEYDPADGNLLLDIRIFDQGGQPATPLDYARTISGAVSRVVCPDDDDCNVDDPTGAVTRSGLVTRFSVPEPAGARPGLAVLAGLGLLAALRAGAGRRRSAPTP